MTTSDDLSLEHFMAGLKRRNPGETEFHQAVEEVATYLIPYVTKYPKYHAARNYGTGCLL